MEIQALREEIEALTKRLDKLHGERETEALEAKIYNLRAELANSLTHGVGVVFFLIAIPILLAYSTIHSSFDYTICCAIFSFGLLITYSSSTLYHSLHHEESKRVLRIFDHVSIFLLIGGSYTPVIYHYLPHDVALPFLAGLWAIIIAGCIFKIFFTGKLKIVSIILYVALGWLVIFEIKPLTAHMSDINIYLLIAEGFFYTGGVLFYVWKKLKYNHAIWHLFVLGGSIAHYFIVLNSAT